MYYAQPYKLPSPNCSGFPRRGICLDQQVWCVLFYFFDWFIIRVIKSRRGRTINYSCRSLRWFTILISSYFFWPGACDIIMLTNFASTSPRRNSVWWTYHHPKASLYWPFRHWYSSPLVCVTDWYNLLDNWCFSCPDPWTCVFDGAWCRKWLC